MYFVMLSAALKPYLTTRMPELWLRVGMCGSGIGVVVRSYKFKVPRILKLVAKLSTLQYLFV